MPNIRNGNLFQNKVQLNWNFVILVTHWWILWALYTAIVLNFKWPFEANQSNWIRISTFKWIPVESHFFQCNKRMEFVFIDNGVFIGLFRWNVVISSMEFFSSFHIWLFAIKKIKCKKTTKNWLWADQLTNGICSQCVFI